MFLMRSISYLMFLAKSNYSLSTAYFFLIYNSLSLFIVCLSNSRVPPVFCPGTSAKLAGTLKLLYTILSP